MPSSKTEKMQTETQATSSSLLEKVQEQTLAVLWVTKENLGQSADNFESLNYLLDGLLVRHCREYKADEKALKKNLFMGQNFGKAFFVGHVKYDKGTFENDLVSFIQMIKPYSYEGSEIVFINEMPSKPETKKKLMLYLNKKFGPINFVSV